AFAAYLASRHIAADHRRASEVRLDVPGAIAVTTGLILLVYALTNAANEGFLTTSTAVPLGLSAVAQAGFLGIERRSASPLMPLSAERGYVGIVPGFVVWAFGASIGFPSLAIAGLQGTKPGEEGLASGLIQTSQRLGFPLGLALLLTVASAFDPGLGVVGFR